MTAMRAQQRHIRGGWSWGHPVGLVATASVRPAVLPIAATTVWVKHGTRIAGVPAGTADGTAAGWMRRSSRVKDSGLRLSSPATTSMLVCGGLREGPRRTAWKKPA